MFYFFTHVASGGRQQRSLQRKEENPWHAPRQERMDGGRVSRNNNKEMEADDAGEIPKCYYLWNE